jgi:glutaminyl-peptide cyclotransferase
MSRRTGLGVLLMSILALALLTVWLRRDAPPQGAAPAAQKHPATNPPSGPAVEHLKVKVLQTYRHDPGAFTQGLVWHGGLLYESTGLRGESTVREVQPETGKVLRSTPLAAKYFGEGLALVDDRLIQITWEEHTAFVYGRADFGVRNQLSYTGDGWGLTYDGKRLIMSDGSDRLTFRDPVTFAAVDGVNVSEDGVPVTDVNELEWVDGAIYANVWQTDRILRIDAATGRVTAEIDASGLLSERERVGVDVLNGIAWRPDTKTFYITGKKWPKMFEVVFVK